MASINKRAAFITAVLPMFLLASASAADWPTWRYDAARSAITPDELPRQPQLLWAREQAPPKPAWPLQGRLDFDTTYEPVVMGKTIFVPSMVSDRVSAYDTQSGKERWRYYADGPVRFAPVAWQGKIYFVSDDGCLHCLDADTGRLVWKFNAAPSDHRVLGHGRLVSAWPARGGPVLVDGTIYFAAGIWPFMGIYLYAVDAGTGKQLWCNQDLDSLTVAMDHFVMRKTGVSAQGYLVLAGDKLLVPCGRSLPACFDSKTGRLIKYVQEHGYKHKVGHWFVSAQGKYVVNWAYLYELEADGNLLPVAEASTFPSWGIPWGRWPTARRPLLTERVVYGSPGSAVEAYGLDNAKFEDGLIQKRGVGGVIKTQPFKKTTFPKLWTLDTGSRGLRVELRTASRLVASATGEVMTVELPLGNAKPRVSWRSKVEGNPASLLVADGKLFVVTRQGRLYCFGSKGGSPRAPSDRTGQVHVAHSTAHPTITASGVQEGYCVVLGLKDGSLLASLASWPKLRVIGVDQNKQLVERLRRALDEQGLYGDRVSLHVGDPLGFALPSYLASLVVSEDMEAAGVGSGAKLAGRLAKILRPYSGVACLSLSPGQQATLAEQLEQPQRRQFNVTRAGSFSVIRRTGALPGSAQWTHRFADASNSLVSKDELVRAPLGVLWFGDPDPVDNPFGGAKTRPSPLVCGGRLFGFAPLSAVDVYTGRLLWKAESVWRTLDNWRAWTSYAASLSAVYVAHGRSCFRFDAATGKVLCQYTFAGEVIDISLWRDVLLVSLTSPVTKTQLPTTKAGEFPRLAIESPVNLARGGLVALDCVSGKCLWASDAGAVVGMAVGGDKVFALFASIAGPAALQAKRRGGKGLDPHTLIAFDARGGKELWRATEDVFGRLYCARKHDLLLQGGRSTAVLARRGSSGRIAWTRPLRSGGRGGSYLLVYPDVFFSQHGGCYDLQTGKEQPERSFQRKGGCNRVGQPCRLW